MASYSAGWVAVDGLGPGDELIVEVAAFEHPPKLERADLARAGERPGLPGPGLADGVADLLLNGLLERPDPAVIRDATPP